MTRNTSDALPFVRERLGAGQRLTAPDKLGWDQKTQIVLLRYYIEENLLGKHQVR